MPGLSATLPMVIFGSLTVAAGLLSLLLPETLMCNMAQTVEEIEKDKEFYGMVCMGKPRPCPLPCPCCRYLSISFTVLKICQIQSEAWLRFLRSMKFFSSQEYLQREPVQYSPIRTSWSADEWRNELTYAVCGKGKSSRFAFPSPSPLPKKNFDPREQHIVIKLV